MLSDYAEADNTRNTGPNHSNIASVLGMSVSTVAFICHTSVTAYVTGSNLESLYGFGLRKVTRSYSVHDATDDTLVEQHDPTSRRASRAASRPVSFKLASNEFRTHLSLFHPDPESCKSKDSAELQQQRVCTTYKPTKFFVRANSPRRDTSTQGVHSADSRAFLCASQIKVNDQEKKAAECHDKI